MKNLLHRLLLPAALLLAGGAANIPERSTSPAAGRDTSVAFRAGGHYLYKSYFRNLVMKVSMPLVATSRMWVMRLSLTGTSSGSMM